jgi:hypothetical protein
MPIIEIVVQTGAGVGGEESGVGGVVMEEGGNEDRRRTGEKDREESGRGGRLGIWWRQLEERD